MYRPVPPARPIIRFSLGDLNTEEEVDYAIGVLGELLPVLRRYQMK